MMGVISPPSVLTATLMSTEWCLQGEGSDGTRSVCTAGESPSTQHMYLLMAVSIQEELTSGTLRRARPDAFTMKSLTDNLYSLDSLFSSLRILGINQTLHMYVCGNDIHGYIA